MIDFKKMRTTERTYTLVPVWNLRWKFQAKRDGNFWSVMMYRKKSGRIILKRTWSMADFLFLILIWMQLEL